MQSLIGIVILIGAAIAFVWSLPRDGKTVWFAGSEWEGYFVVILVAAFGLGIVLAISGLIA